MTRSTGDATQRVGRAVVVAGAAIATVVCWASSWPVYADQARPAIAFRLTDSRIMESSGLAVSTRHKGVTWTHNDSGGGPRLYAVNGDGKTVARLTLADLDPYDWEALATGPGHTLWVGDIGDNSERRETVALFRVREPAELADGAVAWTRFRFRYPDGAHDAEAVLVQPRTGRVYIATKGIVGGTLYAGPERLSADHVNELTRLSGVPPLVTDGAFSPDGSRFVLRGYASAWLYAAPDRQLDKITLPEMEQGESVTFSSDGRALLAGSEGADSPVWRVPLTGRDAQTSSASPGGQPTSDQDERAASGQHSHDDPAPSVVPMLAAGVGVALVFITIGVTVWRRGP